MSHEIKCHKCFKVYHYKCFHTWICGFKKAKTVICPYCQQENVMLYKTTTRWTLPFFKKKIETAVLKLSIKNNANKIS